MEKISWVDNKTNEEMLYKVQVFSRGSRDVKHNTCFGVRATEQDISAPPFRRHRLGATVSALTVSALGLLGAGTSRHP